MTKIEVATHHHMRYRVPLLSLIVLWLSPGVVHLLVLPGFTETVAPVSPRILTAFLPGRGAVESEWRVPPRPSFCQK